MNLMGMSKFTGINEREQENELISTHEQGYVIKYAHTQFRIENSMAPHNIANYNENTFLFVHWVAPTMEIIYFQLNCKCCEQKCGQQ